MTLDEAKEAGLLAEALSELEITRDDLQAHAGAYPDDAVGISLSKNHSDAGHEGLGPVIIVPPELARLALVWLGAELKGRLGLLGVDANG